MADIAVEEGAKLALKFLAPFAGAIALVGAGIVAGEMWEHTKHPTIFGWSFLGRSLSTKLADEIASEPAKIHAAQKQGLDAQAAADKPYFDAWAKRVRDDDAQLKAARDAAAGAVAQQDKFTSNQADAAFRLGRATCGGITNAPSPSGPSGPVAPGGVRQSGGSAFDELFEPGAFTPAGQAALPAGSQSGDPR